MTCFKGVSAEMLSLLALQLNFTFKITNEEKTGIEQENGSWSGMLGKSITLMRGRGWQELKDNIGIDFAVIILQKFILGYVADEKVDFAVSAIGVTKSRSKVFDYLIVWNIPAIGTFYLQNPRNTYDWSVFSRPLYKNAWFSIFIFSIITPTVMTMVLLYSKFWKYSVIA